MSWIFRDDKPVYMQIIDNIKLNIVSGKYAPGSKILSVREFAEKVSVNPNTMQRALSALEIEGLLFTQRNSGRYITNNIELINQTREAIAIEHVKNFLNGITALGYSREEIIELMKKRIGEEYNATDN